MKKITLILAVAILFFSACKSRQYSRNNKQIEKAANKENPNFTTYTTLTYIDAFKAVAIEEMNAYGIPASITLAQGILESGSGNSSLAKYANNHFGIKCTSDWKGKAYYKDDDQNNDCFRVYKDARESYKDHSEFLKRKRYSFLFELDKNDYKNWAQGLRTAGYATNPKYPEMLITVIEKYKLYLYDQPESEKEKISREDRVFTEINANIPIEKKKFTPVDIAPKDPPTSSTTIGNENYYTVKQGDTLFKIAQQYKLTVDDLKTLNKLTDNNIKIGQKLLIVK
ncbi:glucosaminidase domain-containing protein [Pedobacter boryungensis]|uniref:Peptidoglycan hydrolase n=2 Tax=Pedobacter boryungensis TaxID=869962 RepID=A0ABX2DBW2_9SPHI|nr:glucosaminidase domain-containing protein [Pedobacter boryungensis]